MDPNKPALMPPAGIQPNFDNPPNRNVEAHIGIAICIFLVFIGASFRAYSKIFCVKKVHIEDYLALVALGPYIAFIYGVYSLMRTTGIYVHQWNIRASTVPSALYIVYLNTSFFQATMGTIKTAILLDWMRLFVVKGTRPAFWWTCQFIMWATILYYFSVIIVSALSCTPHEKIWNPTLQGTCVNTKALFVTNAVLNLASDIVILLLPQRVIWRLKLSTKKKTGISVVFAVGVIACLVGAARLSRGVMYYLSNDNLYNVSGVFLWCTAELSISFFVLCLPAIPKVFSGDNWAKRFVTRFHSRLSSLRSTTNGTSGADQKPSTWNSSTFSGGVVSESGWNGPVEYVPPHGYAQPDPMLEVYPPSMIKYYTPYTVTYYGSEPWTQEPLPTVWVPTLWPNNHDPSNSWYEHDYTFVHSDSRVQPPMPTRAGSSYV